MGVGIAGLGITAIGFAPALPAAANSMGYLLYGSYAKALTAGGMAIGGVTTGFGVSDITGSVTGYNPVKELVFQGDAAAYSEMEGYFFQHLERLFSMVTWVIRLKNATKIYFRFFTRSSKRS